MVSPWPEMHSEHRPSETVRNELDYISWITGQMLQVGAHSGSEKDQWRDRVHRAYAAVFMPPVPGRGDPYPPDVPASKNPGIWPDVPCGGIPGMTIRHQLTVLGMMADQLRRDPWPGARASEISEWDRRVSLARGLLDHGPDLPLPGEARSQPSTLAVEDAQARDRAVKDALRKRIRRAEASLASAKKSAKAKKQAPAKKAAPKRPAAKKKAKTAAKRKK